MRSLMARTAFLCCLLLWIAPLQAIDSIELRLGQWAWTDYQGRELALQLTLAETGIGLEAQAESVAFPAPIGIVRDLHLHCTQVSYSHGNWSCATGTLRFSHVELGKQQLQFILKANPEKQHYTIQLADLKLADGNLDLDITYEVTAWSLALTADDLSIERLAPWLTRFLSSEQQEVLVGWSYDGRLSGTGHVAGKAESLQKLILDWQASQLNFSNDSGTQVAEQLTLSGKFDGQQQQSAWHWQTALHAGDGQAYFEPVFLDLSAFPLVLDARGRASDNFSEIVIAALKVEQQSVISLEGTLTLQDAKPVSMQLNSQPASMAMLYEHWLQPFTLGTAVAKLQTQGQVAASLDWKPSGYQLALDFAGLGLKDKEQRFELQELTGKLGWSTTETSMATDLTWKEAQLYAITLGEASVKATSQSSHLLLEETVDLPVLDGHLQLSAFDLQHQKSGVNWSFEGLLTPISMESLSEALGWPVLHGKLSGVIPKVSYAEQQLNIAGALQVKVFDGITVIRDLRMTSPFGSLPQLYANIDINDLDLALLTQAFDFGRISGRLEGYVHDLRLSNWEPVQFDAALATPRTNPGKRRISQRAVDNLTQIGGGPSGMLQRGFLQFFEDFSYQKLGLSCRLQNEVCEMSGIEDAKQGYYIVKGGGGLPPWINVVGYTRRVDWSDLIARLSAVRDSEGPVIE